MADLRLFSRDFISEFIELYKSFPCLWQVSTKDYSNRTKRKEAYDALVAKYREVDRNATKDVVKKKLYGLRSSYRRELIKLKKSISEGATIEDVYKPNLWYFYLFDFLTDHDTAKEPTSTTGADMDSVTKNEELECAEDDEVIEYDDETDDSDNVQAVDPFGSDSLSQISIVPRQPHNSTGNSSRPPLMPKKRKLQHQESANQSMDSAILSEEVWPAAMPPPSEDQFDVYGKLVAHKLRSFDKLQVTFSQRLINDVLYEAEMGFLTSNCKVVDMGSP